MKTKIKLFCHYLTELHCKGDCNLKILKMKRTGLDTKNEAEIAKKAKQRYKYHRKNPSLSSLIGKSRNHSEKALSSSEIRDIY